MARVSPVTLNQIFRTGANAGSPIAAFLVGRQERAERERQDELLGLQTRRVAADEARVEILSQPKPTDNFVDLTPEQKRGLGIPETSFAQRNTRTGKVTIDDAPREGALVNVSVGDEGRGRETKAARDRIRQENENMEALLDEVSIAIGRNRDVPGAAGIRGAGAEFIEGTLSQVPGVGNVASEVAEGITGVDATELSKIRTQGRLLVARMVPIVTGDTSGRYTEQEQQRTKEVEAQLEALRTAPQIEGALSEVQAITLRGEVRKRGQEFIDKAAGKSIDLTTAEGINEWGNLLMEKYNLTQEDASAELRRHLVMLGHL